METMSLLGHLAAIATPVALVAGWLRIEKKIRDECAQVRREAEKAHVQIGERIGRLERTVDGLSTEIGNVKHALGRLEGAQGARAEGLQSSSAMRSRGASAQGARVEGPLSTR